MEKEYNDEIKKLQILFEHWIKHNEEHVDKYRSWAEKMEGKGLIDIVKHLNTASSYILEANREFLSASKLLNSFNP